MGARDLVDILDPLVVTGNVVCGETEKLDTSLLELFMTLGQATELGSTDG